MQYYDCVIIDSGVNCEHIKLQAEKIHGISIRLLESGELDITTSFQDNDGHGTAIYNIIKNNGPSNTSILNINIFDKESKLDDVLLKRTLEYVLDNINCKVINISSGVKSCTDLAGLRFVCQKLKDKGIIIVSAFDNEGSMSYPACLECVIGVDKSDDCINVFDYEYVENSPINIRAKGGFQKVIWKDPEYVFVGGSSFSCAYITSLILNLLWDISNPSFERVLELLREHARYIHKARNQQTEENHFFVPERAIIFPFNKEVHSVVAFNELLPFTISFVSDLRASGRVNKKIGDILVFKNSGNLQDSLIADFDRIDWTDSFDTIIVGHVGLYNKLMKRDLLSDIIKLCLKYKKNMICFDDISAYKGEYQQLIKNGCKVYCPNLYNMSFPQNRFGKLYQISQPVVCVCGTSSRQGKFTLQLMIRNAFLKQGYSVGQLGTEPTALLYGMDKVLHYGYSVENNMCFEKMVQHVNALMYDISNTDPDIILSGTQSGTVAYSYDNLQYLTNRQLEVLIGIMPDIVVLCINPQDDINFIKRTISAIEAIGNTSVLCCALYPMKYDEKFQSFGRLTPLLSEESDRIVSTIASEVGVPVYPINENGAKVIANLIIDYFSE